VFDLTNRQSFENLPKWYDLISQHSIIDEPDVLIMGNKHDLEGQSKVTEEDMDQMQRAIKKSMIFEVSARSGYHVLESVERLCIKMTELHKS
jgi:Ras-related protein Rab-6A